MDTQKYNGWTNYATWLVNLHFDGLDFTDEIELGAFDDMNSDDIRCYVASWIQEFVESHVEEYDIPYGRGGFVLISSMQRLAMLIGMTYRPLRGRHP